MVGLGEIILAINSTLVNLKSSIDNINGTPDSNLDSVLSRLSSVNDSLSSLTATVASLNISNINISLESLVTKVAALETFRDARQAADSSVSLTLDCSKHSVFNKSVAGIRQWVLGNPKTGDEGTIYCPVSADGSLNSVLFTVVGKQVSTFAKIDIYDKSKVAIITFKVLLADDTTVKLAYTVWQPLS